MGRPTDCTPEMINKLYLSVKGGLGVEKSCVLAGCSDASFYNWKQRGEHGEQPYLDFLETIKRAEAEWEQEQLEVIKRATEDREIPTKYGFSLSRGDWTASAWLLERRRRQDYGRNATKVKFELPEGQLTVEQLNSLADEIMKKVSRCEMLAEDANAIMQLIELRRKLIETSQLAQRVSDVESILKGGK